MADKPIKAKLKIQLFANDVVVAESTDDVLWRKVLAAMQGENVGGDELGGNDDDIEYEEAGRRPGVKGVVGFAKAIGATKDELVGACEPSMESPHLHLDEKCWAAFKRNTGLRGPSAIGPTQLAGTLLCLWFKYAGIKGKPSQAQALEVLENLGVTDKNSSRSIKNCGWLQNRPDGIQINPAEISKAESVAGAFVTKTKIGSE
jgi:hypothetical protein